MTTWGEVLSVVLIITIVALVPTIAADYAHAQLWTPKHTPTITPIFIDKDSPLVPDGLDQGDKFRLMFATTDTHQVKNTHANYYNNIIKETVANAVSPETEKSVIYINGSLTDGTSIDFTKSTELPNNFDFSVPFDLKEVKEKVPGNPLEINQYSSKFRAFVNTVNDDIYTNTKTTHDIEGQGPPTYWVGGGLVASDYQDLYDDHWESSEYRTVNGEKHRGVTDYQAGWSTKLFATGLDDGKVIVHGFNLKGDPTVKPLGHRSGQVGCGNMHTQEPLYYAECDNNMRLALYGISPVFQVRAYSNTLPGHTFVIVNSPDAITEGANLQFRIDVNMPVEVKLHVSQSGGQFLDSSDLGFHTIMVNSQYVFSLQTIDDNMAESDGQIEVRVVPQEHYLSRIVPIQYLAAVDVADNDERRIIFTTHGGGHDITIQLEEGGDAQDIGFHLTSKPGYYYSVLADWPEFRAQNTTNRLSCYEGGGGDNTDLTDTGPYGERVQHSKNNGGIPDHISYCPQQVWFFNDGNWNTPQFLHIKAGHDYDTLDHKYVIKFISEKYTNKETICYNNLDALIDCYRHPENVMRTEIIKQGHQNIWPDLPSTITVHIMDDDDKQQGQDAPPPPPPPPQTLPVVSIFSAGASNEGEPISFGILAQPPPQQLLSVNITLAHTGELLADANLGQRNIIVPTSGLLTLDIPTLDDNTPDNNTATITILPNDAYTLGQPSSETITVQDNDTTTQEIQSESEQQPPQQEITIRTNLVQNGSFESPQINNNGEKWQIFPDVPGWTVSDKLELQTFAENQYAELDATRATSTSISQTLNNTVVGHSYTLSFDYKAKPGTQLSSNNVRVMWNGVEIELDGITFGNNWQTFTNTIIATGNDTLTLSDAGTSDGQGTFIDNVSVVAEPEQPPPQSEQPQQPQQQESEQSEQPPEDIPTVNLVENGSFESPTVSGGWQFFTDGTADLAWTVSDKLELHRNILGDASDGQQHAELDATRTTSTSISQTLNTIAGQNYTISFDYKARPDTAASTNGIIVTWNNVEIISGITFGDNWQTFTRTVEATGNDVLSLADAGTSDGAGTFIDNVSVMYAQ